MLIERKLTAIMISDIMGHTEQMFRDEVVVKNLLYNKFYTETPYRRVVKVK